MIRVVAAVGFLALNFYVYHFFATNEVRPARASFSQFPQQLGGWVCPERQTMEPRQLANLGVTDYLLCNYRRSEGRGAVGIYVGYHQTQVRREGGGSKENSIHPPRHCLPGSGWDIIGHETVDLDLPGLPGRPARVNRLVIAKGDSRSLVYYWYQSRGRVIAEDWKKIVLMSWDRARRGRTDGSLIRFTVPIAQKHPDRAERNFQELASQLVPELARFVPE